MRVNVGHTPLSSLFCFNDCYKGRKTIPIVPVLPDMLDASALFIRAIDHYQTHNSNKTEGFKAE